MKDYDVKTIQVREGLTVAYREAGQTDCPDKLLLIHGNMSSSVHFVTLMNGLEETYHILALDLPGMGESSYPSEYNTLMEYAQDVRSFVEALHFRPFSVLGWSTGGGIALELAYLIPEQVKAIGLLSSVGLQGYKMYRKGEDGLPLMDQRLYNREDIAQDPIQVAPAVAILAGNHRDRMKQIWEGVIYTHGTPVAEEYERYIDGTMQQRNLVDIDVALTNFNITGEDDGLNKGSNHIAQITCPIVIIHGQEDKVVPVQEMLSAKDLLKDQAEVYVIEGAGHSLIQDAFDRLVEIIKSHL